MSMAIKVYCPKCGEVNYMTVIGDVLSALPHNPSLFCMECQTYWRLEFYEYDDENNPVTVYEHYDELKERSYREGHTCVYCKDTGVVCRNVIKDGVLMSRVGEDCVMCDANRVRGLGNGKEC